MPFLPLLSPKTMHIPDGFLSVIISFIFWVMSIVVITIALRKTNRDLSERQVPLMGVLAAAIFAGQMLNFTVIGGTSGHLLGAALATILLGPWPAIVVITSVVSIQALIFQDGGLIVLGANIFNMAIISVLVSNSIFSLTKKLIGSKKWGITVSGFLAAWGSIFLASLSCALQLAISGTSPANIVIPAMAGIHAVIGIGEGLISAGAIIFISAARKDLLEVNLTGSANNKGILVGGSIIAVILAILSPFASSHPDGLEWVAEQSGFLGFAKDAFYNIIPDYTFPGINDPAIATIVAGIIGVIIVLTVVVGLSQCKKQATIN
ncbi:MAG: energy-coupling factor ABC transporter permease [Anaerolineaceae bacterium]|nr:energy-coupling factor ABC transporter permease [Anaerolineaceae bacterium]